MPTGWQLLRQLKDESSAFYNYKTQKAKDPKARYQDQITADDICWGLAPSFLRSYD